MRIPSLLSRFFRFKFAVAFIALVAAASALTNPNMMPVIDEALIRAVKESGAEFVPPFFFFFCPN